MPLTAEETKIKNREACKRWREKNADYNKLRQQNYWAANPDKKRAKNRRWRLADPERAKKASRDSYARTKNNDRLSNTLEYRMWWNARKRATKQNIPFNIDRSDVVVTELCPIFKTKLETKHPLNEPSLDRVVPELGYVKGNVVVISRAANTIKSFGTAQEHRLIAEFMENHINRPPFVP